MTTPRPSPRPQPSPAPPSNATPRQGSVLRAVASVPKAVAHTARDTAKAARERPEPLPARRRRRWEPPIDAHSWSGALAIMVVIVGALWVVQIVDSQADLNLQQYGIRPRDVDGLRGIVIAPFVHGGYRHMLSNTVPLIAIGWVVLLAGVRVWALVTAVVIVVGGALTWLIGPSNSVIVGASGVVFGWLGYLLARALFSRSIKWIIVAALVLGFFGALLPGLFPTLHSSNVSWQGHVAGFAAGLAVGWVLHPRGTELRRFRRTVVS